MGKISLILVAAVVLGPKWVRGAPTADGPAMKQLEQAAVGPAQASKTADGSKTAPQASLVSGKAGQASKPLDPTSKEARPGARIANIDEELGQKAEDSGGFATIGYALVSPIVVPIAFTAAGIIAGAALGSGMAGVPGAIVGGFLGAIGGLVLGAVLGVVGLVTGVFKGIGKIFQGKF
jgi:hypothetical protein